MDNPNFMTLNCAVSCGICKPACKDQHNDCPGWAKDGECATNPGHVMKVCPTSCNLSICKDAVCADKNHTACTMWGINDECLKNPVFMMAECPVTCGACLNVCQDKDRSCQVRNLSPLSLRFIFDTTL